MAQADFASQLRGLGFTVTEVAPGKITFPYTVESGTLVGREIMLGFEVPADFSLTPPPGPHVSPRLHSNQGGGEHPTGGIHDSPPFGSEWQYWSRPMQHWNETTKDARAVMAHVRHLFDTQ